jgi:hypothetical protein
VQGTGDSQKALAIQSIADPSAVDAMGQPKPVAVNPIVNRVVKAVIDQIKDAINSLKDMGIASVVVEQLTRDVVNSVAESITQVIESSANDVINVPEGQSLADVIQAQEDEFELQLPPNEIANLNTLVENEDELTQEQVTELETTTINAEDKIKAQDSKLTSTLDTGSQGLLSGLANTLAQTTNSAVDTKIQEVPAEAFGVNPEDPMALQTKLAAQKAEQEKQLRVALQRFFLSMGLGVVVEENTAGDAAVVAVNVQAPFYLRNCELPGGIGFGDRGVRVFKVGAGALDSGSAYVETKPACTEEVESTARPTAQSLTTLAAMLPEQSVIDDAFARIASDANENIATATQADYELIERVRLFHELNEKLTHTTLVSAQVIDTLVANSDTTVRIKTLASVLASHFKWSRETVNLTPEGFPIFTQRNELLAGGASAIESSELVSAMSLTLAEDPSEAARFLTERLSFYAQFAPDAVQTAIERQRYEAGNAFNVATALAAVYPTTAEAYRDLIVGAQNGDLVTPAEPAYKAARDRVVRGLTSAVPSSLFGRTLTSESEINIRSALFFMDLII